MVGNFELLVLENPLLDIQAQGDDALLEKYGLKANDAILAEEKHMGIYEDLQGRDAKLIAGGAAQNSARGAQYMLPADTAVYIGCVGKDKYADHLREANKTAGLRAEYLVDEKEPTGRCGVVITGHNRSMCTHLAAANNYKLEHLKSEPIWKLAQNAKFYYVGGYHLTVCVPAIMALAEEAAEKDKVFALGMGAPFIPLAFKDQLDQTAPYWDYVFMNEAEAAAWASTHGHEQWGEKDTDKIARALAELPKKNTKRKRVAVISQGTEPTIVAVQGESDVRKYPVHEVKKEEIVDTNGAG